MKKITVIFGPAGSGKTSKMRELAGARKFGVFDAESLSDNQFLVEGFEVVGFEGVSRFGQINILIDLAGVGDPGVLVRPLYGRDRFHYKVPEIIATILPGSYSLLEFQNNPRVNFIDLTTYSFKKVH